MTTSTLPPWLQSRELVIQTTDPHRKPVEPPVRSMKEFDRAGVLRRYGWTNQTFDEVVAGLADPIRFPRRAARAPWWVRLRSRLA